MSTEDASGRRRLSVVTPDLSRASRRPPESKPLPLDHPDKQTERDIIALVADQIEDAILQLPAESPWRDSFARDVRLLRVAANLPLLKVTR